MVHVFEILRDILAGVVQDDVSTTGMVIQEFRHVVHVAMNGYPCVVDGRMRCQLGLDDRDSQRTMPFRSCRRTFVMTRPSAAIPAVLVVRGQTQHAGVTCLKALCDGFWPIKPLRGAGGSTAAACAEPSNRQRAFYAVLYCLLVDKRKLGVDTCNMVFGTHVGRRSRHHRCPHR